MVSLFHHWGCLRFAVLVLGLCYGSLCQYSDLVALHCCVIGLLLRLVCYWVIVFVSLLCYLCFVGCAVLLVG